MEPNHKVTYTCGGFVKLPAYYSRVRNKHRGTFINFWTFFQGLHPYKGGYAYYILDFLFVLSFFMVMGGYAYTTQ